MCTFFFIPREDGCIQAEPFYKVEEDGNTTKEV